MLDLKALTDYGNWIGETAWEVHWSVMRVGGWQQVFPVPSNYPAHRNLCPCLWIASRCGGPWRGLRQGEPFAPSQDTDFSPHDPIA